VQNPAAPNGFKQRPPVLGFSFPAVGHGDVPVRSFSVSPYFWLKHVMLPTIPEALVLAGVNVKRLKEVALEYTFVFDILGMKELLETKPKIERM
jgi:hypothetical protein